MPNLGISYIELCKEIGLYLGWGSDDVSSATKWATDSDKLAFVDDCVKVAMAMVWYNDHGYEWRFFKPVRSIAIWTTQSATAADVTAATLTFSSPNTTITMDSSWTGAFYPSMVGKSVVFGGGNSYVINTYTSASAIQVTGDASSETTAFSITADGDYRLPADFSGLEGDLTFGPGDSGDLDQTVKVRGTYHIRANRARLTTTGRPRICAVEPIESDLTADQVFELQIYPSADAAYTLFYEALNDPEPLSTTNLYPPGGSTMREVYRKAALAAAEEKSQSPSTEKRVEFHQALQAATQRDAALRAPEKLGYNADKSIFTGDALGRRHHNDGRVTFTITEGGVDITP